VNFNGRAAKFARMTNDGAANDDHLRGEARELSDMLNQVLGDGGGDESAQMSRQYRHEGGLTIFTPTRR